MDTIDQIELETKQAQLEALKQQSKRLEDAKCEVNRQIRAIQSEATQAQRKVQLATMSLVDPTGGLEEWMQPGAAFAIKYDTDHGRPYQTIKHLGVPTKYGWHLGLGSSGIPGSEMLGWVDGSLTLARLAADEIKFHAILAFQPLYEEFGKALRAVHNPFSDVPSPPSASPFDLFFGDDWRFDDFNYSDGILADE